MARSRYIQIAILAIALIISIHQGSYILLYMWNETNSNFYWDITLKTD